jgi:hypothetical protein
METNCKIFQEENLAVYLNVWQFYKPLIQQFKFKEFKKIIFKDIGQGY